MFTGIIEEIGTIRGIKRGNRSVVLEVQAKKVLEDLHVGDSIATNGVCLTVISFANGSFCADVMPETMQRSHLDHDFSPGRAVAVYRGQRFYHD